MDILGYILVPWLIRTGYKMYMTKSPSKSKLPWTLADTLASFWLSTVMALCIAYIIILPPNVLKDWNILETTPSFLHRVLFREYMTLTYPGWPNINTSSIESIESLFETLKSTERRDIYSIYGHDAFTSCSWCDEKYDYAVYDAAVLGLQYVTFLMSIGWATMTSTRIHTRYWIVLGILALFSTDMYMLFFAPSLTLKMVDSPAKHIQYNQMQVFRMIGFASLAGLSLVWVKRYKSSDGDALMDLIRSVQANYSRETAVRLARAATLSDTNLRREFLETVNLKQVQNTAMDKDPEYLALKRETLKRQNISKVIDEALGMTRGLIGIAQVEGGLGPVEPFDWNPDSLLE